MNKKEFVKVNIPSDAISILNIIEDAGYEAYVVGGCVRDSIIGKIPHDWDITTSMTPSEVVCLFNKKYPVIPTGIEHGTVTVFINGEGYEVTTYRTDGDYSDGRHPDEVSFCTSIEKDLSRRDFTMNAIAYSPTRGFVDLFGGIQDIQNNVIRAVGNATTRFEEDALRMMRAIRFSAQLGFRINDDTFFSISKCAKNIEKVSAERVHDEIIKLISSKHPEYIVLLHDSGLLKYILPELDACFLTGQKNPWHCYDNVGTHTMAALKSISEVNLPYDTLTVRLAIMLHDIGKVECKETDENGIDHFIGHAEKSAEMSYDILRRLRFTNKEVGEVVALVFAHDVQIGVSARSIRRFIKKFHFENNNLFEKELFVKIADNYAQNRELSKERVSEMFDIFNIYKNMEDTPLSIKELAVNGRDVMDKGHKGIRVGEILKELLEIVIEEPSLNTREYLLTKIPADD